MSDGVLIVFTRSPVVGQCKTRLIPRIGAQAAAELQNNMLDHTLKVARETRFRNIWLCVDDMDSCDVLDSYAKQYNVRLILQQGRDLGQRMYNVLNLALSYYAYTVLVGTDCPRLDKYHLDQANDSLIKGNDIVLGPTYDGGYYLIGGRKIDSSLFDAIPWSTIDVANQTRQRLKSIGYTWDELEMLWDVDNPEDLTRLTASEYSALTGH